MDLPSIMTAIDSMQWIFNLIFRLYIAGCEPIVNNLYPPIEYPVPRGTPSIAPYVTWFHGDCDVVKPHFRQTFVSWQSQFRINSV